MKKSTRKSKVSKIPYPSALIDKVENLEDEIRYENLPNWVNKLSSQYQQDYKQARRFLLEYKASIDTFNSYRRDIERLLQWCINIRHAAFPQLTRDDILTYVEFCEHPPSHWIAESSNVPRFIIKNAERIPNSEWRPFVVRVPKAQNKTAKASQFKLSNNAIKALFRILSSFFRYLYEEDYISANPVAKIRQKSRFVKKTVETRLNRTLSDVQWLYVIDAAETMADENPASHERALFIMSALYAMYLRISELTETPRWTPTMNHFYKDSANRWWFKTVGKGNKEREITVSDDMLRSLKRYRQHLGLTSLPNAQDNSPLIPKNRGTGGISSTRQIRRIVQECFDVAAERLMEDGLQEDGDALKAATVHWMRHTGISNDIQHRQREHVRDDAGHSSSAITDLYIDVEKKDRHKSGKKKQLVPS